MNGNNNSRSHVHTQIYASSSYFLLTYILKLIQPINKTEIKYFNLPLLYFLTVLSNHSARALPFPASFSFTPINKNSAFKFQIKIEFFSKSKQSDKKYQVKLYFNGNSHCKYRG